MGDITLRQIFTQPLDLPVYPVVLLIMTLLFLAVLIRIQLSEDSVDLRWLIMDRPHRPSLPKIGQVVALAVSTWGFVVLSLNNQLTETYFIGYMCAWSGSAALDTYLSRGRPRDRLERASDPAEGEAK